MAFDLLMLRALIKTVIKHVAFNTPLHKPLFRVYDFMYEPTQLVFLTECVKAVSTVPGAFVEVGCAFGATTVFLNKFMDEMRQARDYYAIDTFSGFVKDHVNYEVTMRGKSPKVQHKLHSIFTDNKQSWFDKTMQSYGIRRVKSIRADVTDFDFSEIAPIAFGLLDVDLYIPVKICLPKLYAAMSPGGVLVVDDCRPDGSWDGALQAYEEFIIAKHLPREIACDKLGVIRAASH